MRPVESDSGNNQTKDLGTKFIKRNCMWRNETGLEVEILVPCLRDGFSDHFYCVNSLQNYYHFPRKRSQNSSHMRPAGALVASGLAFAQAGTGPVVRRAVKSDPHSYGMRCR